MYGCQERSLGLSWCRNFVFCLAAVIHLVVIPEETGKSRYLRVIDFLSDLN
jgi:hypothetical protein